MLARDVQQLIFALPVEELRQAIAQFLKQQFPAELDRARVEPMPQRYDRGTTHAGVKLGRYLVGVQKSGAVTVSVTQGSGSTVAMQKAVTNLLDGLAGLAQQRQLARAVIEAGYVVEQIQQAPNGALVLEVEL
jgi:hypothetical protein